MNSGFSKLNFLNSKKNFLALWIAFFTFAGISASFAQGENLPDPVQLFQEGQSAHERGELKIALEFYDAAIKVAPEFPEAEYQRGAAFVSLNKPQEAEKAFRRAIELRENWSLPMTALGILLVQEGNFKEAEKFLLRSIEISDVNFAAYTALADLKLRTNADRKTLATLLTKVQYLTGKANPTAGIWTSRAALERALDEKDSARKSVNQALLIDADYKPALIERAELSLSEGDYTSALRDAEKIKRLSPGTDESEFLKARIKFAEGDFSGSLEILDSIENPLPAVLAFRDKITLYNSESAEDLENQLKADEKNAAILGRLCYLYWAEDPAKSLDYCKRAYEAESNNINYVIGFAAALVQAKKFEAAVQILRQVLDVVPDNYTARANLAIALFQLNRFEEAKAEYEWLTRKQPDLPIAFYFLAITHDRLKEYIDAMANYQQFLRLADSEKNKVEIEMVNLRMPALQKFIKQGKGKN